MLLWCFLTIQFAVTSGDLACFFNAYPKCAVRRINSELCPYVPAAIQCMKEKAIECDVEDSTVVIGMEQIFKDTCQEGTELYKAYLKHEECVFGLAPNAAFPCYKDLAVEHHDYNLTGEGNDLGRLKLACRFENLAFRCIIKKVAEICGEEAVGYYNEFYGPSTDLINTVCMENRAASFDFTWTILLQASTVLFILKLSNLTM